ncbi:hypothetical protein PACTADRAFT_4193 [Pachysolen tannophilus NRRL Y-2460]|uniref:VPS9 domain-containing protein n=1 Tax=Pachysolen tannophilus NRRL Y-2460 TaxID=669874 RepID=A0A1E4TR49_PACTA|nr:hypothetical protein PACTADRAFT_4193 [Pachysolen tannophilus NRRL Y-2460]
MSSNNAKGKGKVKVGVGAGVENSDGLGNLVMLQPGSMKKTTNNSFNPNKSKAEIEQLGITCYNDNEADNLLQLDVVDDGEDSSTDNSDGEESSQMSLFGTTTTTTSTSEDEFIVLGKNDNTKLDTIENSDTRKVSSGSLNGNLRPFNLRASSQLQLQQFDFNFFLNQLKVKNCEPILKYIKSFLTQFQKKNWNVDEQVKLIKDFEKFIYEKIITIRPFNEYHERYQLDNIKEGFEKLITTRVYRQIFSPVIPKKNLSEKHQQEDLLVDLKLKQNLSRFKWLEPRHLDLPESLITDGSSVSFIKSSVEELNKLNKYRSPRDKIICFLNCCKLIFILIRQQYQKNKLTENADSLIPATIYVILQAQPKYLFSNLNYIERFRNEAFLQGEPLYYISTMKCACNFLIDITKGSLTIDEEEYNTKLKEAELKIAEDKMATVEKMKNKTDSEAENQSSILGLLPQQFNNLSPLNNLNQETPATQFLSDQAEILQQKLSNLNLGSQNNLFSNFSNLVNKFGNTPLLASSPSSSSSSNSSHSSSSSSLSSIGQSNGASNYRQYQEQDQDPLEANHVSQQLIDDVSAMFPDLDKNIVGDIVATKGGNIGECVDFCLELQG